MLTPPASAGRRGVAPLQQRPPMPDTPTYSRLPAGNAGYAGNSREFSRVPIVSADHSRSASNGSQQQQPSLPDDAVSLVLGFLSRPAAGPAGSEHVPAAVEETILSDRGFDPNAEVGGERTTLLHVATRHGHWGAVRLLLQRGADAARPSRDGTTALMLAASQPLAYAARQARVFEWLLDAFEAALIKRDKKGRTAVHWVSLAGAHEPAALYYSTLLVRKLASRQLIEVVSWCDYLGCSASKLAVDCGLLRVADVLQQAAAQAASAALERSGSSASTVSLNSTGSAPAVAAVAMPSSLARRGGDDRYEAAARRASGLMCAATDDMRREHQQQRCTIDADTEYAAQLLLELRSERDAACADADAYAAVAQQCDTARRVEDTMRRRVEQTVGLQHVARTSKLVQEASSSSSSPVVAARPATTAGAPERLLAEYAMLRARAADYEHSSRVLGHEYAELASVVRPWATPGGGGEDEAEDTAALCVVLQAEEQRLHKLERVVAAACGDLTLDRVRTVVGPVLSVLNSGATK
ncbi:Transcription factor mbp1 [Coemansia sp. RSA 2424]|nr:Transcription factor mbp1 [Coemansia sp. RSA 2424]